MQTPLKLKRVVLVAGVGLVIFLAVTLYTLWPRPEWSEAEIATLRSLWIGSLPPLPPDPSNAYGDEPLAATLGHKLFFDTRFSSNGKVACASCHQPDRQFQDGLPLGVGVGTTNRKTMPLLGTAYSPWQFWDGRKDSQWAQALGPLESAVEHGGTRTQYAHLIDQYYRADYEALFGTLPDLSDRTRFPDAAGPVDDPALRAAWDAMRPEDRETITGIYANMGKALAAYERRLMPGPSRFDRYVEALLKGDTETMHASLNAQEVAGLRLFTGKAQCINCHNGPLFTNNSFHNTGVPPRQGMPKDEGRLTGAQQVLADEFNCLSKLSDAQPEQCAELRYLDPKNEHFESAFKPPSLRNVAEAAPYMDVGQFPSLPAVLKHYNTAPPAAVGHSELQPLHLTDQELAQLEAFLRSLSGPPSTPPELLAPPK